ncbi:YcnI family protein [Shimazuella kribbensis]|uniref:YcnI family copper-binding membrane protein n=1 Tax=Shimazuella kribbensis TaxID=139808 RepID=UPI00040EDB62|nr:YcnI family protein [Shimazuella kribbensis]
MKKYVVPVTLFALFIFFGFVTTVDAHVTVWPKESKVGAYEKYTVRVPSEKESNTTKVELEFPKEVSVNTVHPVPGWSYQFIKGSDGKNTGIVWTATDEGIKAHEFFEFPFIGANPDQAASLSWKAHQTYADGTVVDWAGAPESEKPASVTNISVKTGAVDENHTTDTNPIQTNSTDSKSQWIAIALAALALLFSLINLFRKKATNE